MCRQCETHPVYEFTNKRKLCAGCFVRYFEKKVLYTMRKFGMIKKWDIIGYRKNNSLKGAVLEKILFFIHEKSGIEIIRLPGKKATKIASSSSIDSEAGEILKSIVSETSSDLKKELPVEGKIIKPLYLFLDEEIAIYASLKKLKFIKKKKVEEKTEAFINNLEKKHPEVKRAVVNSLLELYRKQ